MLSLCIQESAAKGRSTYCKQAGVIGAMGGVIGSLQAMEAIKYLIGVGDLSDRISSDL